MHGDHEKLKILLQNFLIASRFNQKLVYKENERLFIENSSQKTRTVRFAEGRLDGRDRANLMGQDPTRRIALRVISAI